jgi:hypothetical protein
MTKTTRPQRQSILKFYRRAPIIEKGHRLTYREFRARALPTIGCDGAVALPWASMVLCIERDGYTHS